MGGSSNNQIPETPEEKTLATIASERWNDYKQRFIPVENRAMGQVEQMGQSPLLPNLANVNTQMQFSQGQDQLTAGMTNRGMRLGSPGFGMNLADFNMDRTASSGLGQANAYGMRTTQYLNNLQALVGLGQGKSTASLSGMSDVSSMASRQAIIDAQAAIAARGAIGQGIGTAAGIAYGNYQNTGNIAGTRS